MVVARLELDLELDATEERRRWMEDEAVGAGLERLGEARASVGVGLGARDPTRLRGAARRRRPLPGGRPLCRARGSRARRSCGERSRLERDGPSRSRPRRRSRARRRARPSRRRRRAGRGDEARRTRFPRRGRRRRRARGRRCARPRSRRTCRARGSRCRPDGARRLLRACRAGSPRAPSSRHRRHVHARRAAPA